MGFKSELLPHADTHKLTRAHTKQNYVFTFPPREPQKTQTHTCAHTLTAERSKGVKVERRQDKMNKCAKAIQRAGLKFPSDSASNNAHTNILSHYQRQSCGCTAEIIFLNQYVCFTPCFEQGTFTLEANKKILPSIF